MLSINLINEYTIKPLSIDNHRVVEELCDKCSDYYILHDGILPTKKEIVDIFTALPQNKCYRR